MVVQPAPSLEIPPALTEVIVPTPTALLVQSCPQGEDFCVLDGHFWLMAPIIDGNQRSSDGYRFGSTQNGTRETHHGVEFENPSGTTVGSAADGVVVFADADDAATIAWVPAFYGNVVVIKHPFPGYSTPLYTVYGHLSTITVENGESVMAGQKIGEVGATGTAQGSHLHFETRAGTNDYDSARNPILWVQPADEMGVIAGVVVDSKLGDRDVVINVQRVEDGALNPISVTSIETYDRNLLPVQGDSVFHENFAAGNIPAGIYRLSLVYNGKVFEKIIEVKSKQLTYVNFIVE